MRITAILLLAASMHVYAKGTAQKLSFTGKNVPIEQVFSAIEKQTGYVVFFDYASIAQLKTVTLSVKDMAVTEVLRACFKDQPVDFSIQGKNILIAKRPPTPEAVAAYQAPPPPTDIRGMVADSTGNPLAGAAVLIKGTNKGTHTDERGAFVLKDAGENIELEITYTGYDKTTVKVNRPSLYIVLKASNNPLDETIVQAYGTTTRRFNVGSIYKVSKEEIRSQPVFNPLSALEGRVPGLLVTTQSGIPGAAIRVQIRGQNTISNTPSAANRVTPDNPFFVIDGVPFAPQNNSFTLTQTVADNTLGLSGYGLSAFNNINPADIESIEVLKDADATAIYGARGANGVILITTRKGVAGKPTLTGSLNTGVSRISRSMPLMSTQEYLAMRKEAFKNDGLTPTATPNNNYAPDLLLFDQNRNTDFLHEMMGRATVTSGANLFFSGGTNSNTFSLGVAYDKQGNAFPGDFVNDRMSVNAGLHHVSANRRFNADFSTNYSYSKNNLPGSPTTATAFTLPPNFPALRKDDGSLLWAYNGIPYSTLFSSFLNPYSYLEQTSNVSTNNLQMNLNLGYKILPGLSFKTNLGYSLFMSNEYKKYPLSAQDPYSSYRQSNATQGKSDIYTWNIEPQLSYETKLGDGRLSVLAGTTFQKSMTNSITLNGSNYLNDALMNSITAAGTITTSIGYNPYKYNAFFGRINYVYQNRYILNLTGRTDGSSKFINDRQWGRFSAVGAGWIFTEESFLKGARKLLSFGKLRGSYGSTGNDNVGNYLYYTNWVPNGANYNYAGSLGYYPNNLDNPDYSWSTTKKLEAGIELGFLGDRLLLNATWFRNRTSNQLIQYQLPTQTGFSNVTKNFEATIQNSGWEFVLNATTVKAKDFIWKTSFNISFAKNKLIAFPGLEKSSYALYYTIGESTSNVRGYRYAGINDATGVYQFYTQKGEVTYSPQAINNDNRFLLGNTDPKYYGGLRNNFTYKRFSAELFLEFRKQWGPNFINTLNGTPGNAYNMPAEFLDRWTGPGSNATYQKFTSVSFGSAGTPAAAMTYLRSSDFSYSDVSYIRFKTLGLSYTINPAILKKIRMTSCTVQVAAQNLFVITGYKGHDPETPSYYSVPPMKTISGGLQFNF